MAAGGGLVAEAVGLAEALDVPWEPSTAGCVADVRPGTTVAEVEEALMGVYDRYATYMGYGPVTRSSGSR